MKKLLIVVGPSGSGKTYLTRNLKNTGKLPEVVSHTTRAMRSEDVEGENYYFTNVEKFSEIPMVESAVYSGNHYGVSVEEIRRILPEPNSKAFLVADIQGLRIFKEKAEELGIEVVSLFIKADDKCFIDRLTQRGDNPSDIQKRMDYAMESNERDNHKYCDHIFVNDDNATIEAFEEFVDKILGSELFVTIEGPEGSGKTTVINILNEMLDKAGISRLITREPGGSGIAEQIRGVILDKKNTDMDGITEAMLYAAARRQHLVDKVVPALNDNKLVICDRFIHSSLAYQGVARGLGVDLIRSINNPAIEGLYPSRSYFLMVDPSVGLSRINNNGRETNRLDHESMQFHNSVYDAYMDMYADSKNPLSNDYDKIVLIHTDNKTPQAVADIIFADIICQLSGRKISK